MSQQLTIPNFEDLEFKSPTTDSNTELVQWIVSRVDEWEKKRDQSYRKRWARYYRLWRGFWTPEDKNKQSERSRIITPVLSQAIEMSVAELEEAIFGNEAWFDIEDDIGDEEKDDATQARDQLLEDMELVDVKGRISEALLNAAIFGTGIIKINTRIIQVEQGVRRTAEGDVVPSSQERRIVTYESVRPEDFIPDPAGETIPEMLGCAHKIRNKPLHAVLEGIEEGRYREDAIVGLLSTAPTQTQNDPNKGDMEDLLVSGERDDGVEIIEYHGKVPAKFLPKDSKDEDRLASALQEYDENPAEQPVGNDEMVEAIVTIANGQVLLSAKVNPFVMKDRSFVAWPWEKVPGRFWGRGVAEKGFNPQLALDAEVRMRIDALGFLAAPMTVTNAAAIPRGFSTKVYPGKNFIVQGIPKESIDVLSLNANIGQTFNQSGDMERLVELGTGALNAATPMKQNTRNSTARGGDLIRSAFVKRSKRAIYSADRNLLSPLIRKSMWRYMQYDGNRYPQDYKFVVKATMGIIAREQETLELTQLLGMMGDEYPNVKVAITRGIVENTSVKNKKQIMDLIDEAIKPPSKEEQEQQQRIEQAKVQQILAEAAQSVREVEKTQAEIEKLKAEAQAAREKADREDEKLTLEAARIAQAKRQNVREDRRLELEEERLKLDAEELKVARQKLNKGS